MKVPSAAANASKNARGELKTRCLLFIGLTLPCVAAGADKGVSAFPFAQRSTDSQGTLFTELLPERTGIVTTNRYDDPRIWGERHSEHNVGAIGTGVAAGDFDNDGYPDLYVSSKVESGRLFRNRGNWSFEDVTASAGVEDSSGEWKQGAAFVDVDNDGWLDLYVCRFDAPNQLFMNQGDGTFRDEAVARGLAVVDASGMGCFADYDRDGWIDVYVQTNLRNAQESIEGERDYLFRNNGDGTFRNVTDEAGILNRPTQGHSATWWDQDEDGWLDLYVANDFAPPDFLYRNNRDGTFTNVIGRALPHTPFSSMGSDLGDVDNDGRIDFFVADMAGTTHEFTQRGLTDSRARMTEDHHDRLDTAIQLHYNSLYLNTGLARSLEGAYLAGLPGTDWTWAPRFEDLNQDGLLDLFVTNGMDREHNNLDFIVKKLTAVNLMGRIRITKTSPILNQANLAYVNRGNLRFEEVGEQWGLNQVGVSFGSAFADFDRDGDLDVAFTNFQKGATVLRNDGQDGSSIIFELRGTDSNRFGLGGRVEIQTAAGKQVRQLISARGYLSTSEPILHFGLGEEKSIRRAKVVWPNGGVQLLGELSAGNRYVIEERLDERAAGIDADSASDPLFAEVSQVVGIDVVQEEEKLEGTVSQPLMPKRFNRRGPGLAVGDLDGDGVDEILVAATAVDGAKLLGKDGKMYRKMDTGSFGDAPPINDGPPLIFDANGDGLNDLWFTGGGAALPGEEPEYQPRLWLNRGDGAFAPAPDDAVPYAPITAGAAVAADFDRDGRLDVFLGGRLYPGFYPEPAISALLMQRENGFSDETDGFGTELAEVGLVTSALASDVDGDGWIDLLIALEWGGVRCFRNVEGEAFVDVSSKWGFDSAGLGLWTSLAAADFNGDGKMDYAIGNQGLNTLYSASEAHPMKLFGGDFSGSHQAQLILAHNVEGRLLPVASRDELAAKIPAVKDRYPSNNDYAAATLPEILGEELLDEAEVYRITELRSGVLLSGEGSGFTFQPLPRYAQLSPAQGMAARDFDGDGNGDLLLVNNDYSAIPPLGRFDSGLGWLLKGDGQGGFTCVDLRDSGWVVPGDAKALAVADLNQDAWPDAVVSRNRQPTLAFENRGFEGMIPIALRLVGRKGNPDGIGSRVTLLIGGEMRQSAEVHAGGGYASQSTPTQFFAIPETELSLVKWRIRWPSGAVTEAVGPEGGGYMTVRE